MLNKRGQGLSVHTIIVAIIGLIILVAIILMLTGKLGAFGEGAETQVTAGETLWTQLGWGGGEGETCTHTCETTYGSDLDMVIKIYDTRERCENAPWSAGGKNFLFQSGDFTDVQDDKVCCCRINV